MWLILDVWCGNFQIHSIAQSHRWFSEYFGEIWQFLQRFYCAVSFCCIRLSISRGLNINRLPKCMSLIALGSKKMPMGNIIASTWLSQRLTGSNILLLSIEYAFEWTTMDKFTKTGILNYSVEHSFSRPGHLQICCSVYSIIILNRSLPIPGGKIRWNWGSG